MRWRYDQRLIESVIFQEVERAEAAGSGAFVGRYRRLMSPLYELREGDGREQAFFNMHWRIFIELGFDGVLSGVLARHPRIAAQVPEGLVARAVSAHEERAELFARDGSYTTVVMRLRSDRFLNRKLLISFCRHELGHIDDMLDPAFAYRREDLADGALASATSLVRGRYRILWSVSIDGRLIRAGDVPLMSREQRVLEFERAFPFAHAGAFDRLWTGPRPAHQELLEMAQRPRAVLGADDALARLGLPCPLCNFPTHAWVGSEQLADDIFRRIQAEFPSWDRSEGLCARCAEVYAIYAEAEGVNGHSRL